MESMARAGVQVAVAFPRAVVVKAPEGFAVELGDGTHSSA